MPLWSSFSHGAWHCHHCLCAKNYPQRLSHSSTGGLSQKFRSEHAACSSLLSLLNIEKKTRIWSSQSSAVVVGLGVGGWRRMEKGGKSCLPSRGAKWQKPMPAIEEAQIFGSFCVHEHGELLKNHTRTCYQHSWTFYFLKQMFQWIFSRKSTSRP